jgi:hypothetical protein
MNQINVVSASLLLLVSLFAGTTSSLAQTEGWLRGPGVKAGKESTCRSDQLRGEQRWLHQL